MALVSDSTGVQRIYGPSFGFWSPTRGEQARSKSRLRDKIHGVFCKAMERLNFRARPHLVTRFIHSGGFCFGLLDPVSNIVANTLIPYERGPTCDERGGQSEVGELDEEPTSGVVPVAELKDLERRSLDGMVTFLTRFFPYLTDCEAVSYLLVADADVLVAARIIALDRQMKNFGSFLRGGIVEDALTMALKCSALAARHPEPDRFVDAWRKISSRYPYSVDLLSKVSRRSPSSSLGNFSILFYIPHMGIGRMWELWLFTSTRRPRRCSVPYQPATALKRVLLDAIHGFYLEALARLPAGELQSRYHRSLLKAGHCYGPLDPVSNIILNTVWYDAAFPRTHELELDMVSTLSLHRMGTRSLYGLASFLCTRYHHLDFDGAMRCLLQADANLLQADPNLDPAVAKALRMEKLRRSYNSPWTNYPNSSFVDNLILGSEEGWKDHSPWSTTAGFRVALSKVATVGRGPNATVNEAFKAAAAAACHPNPDAQVNLLASCKEKLGSALYLLQGGGHLSSEDVQHLARLLCPEVPCSEQSLPPFPFKEYVCVHTRISKKVNAALNSYARMPNGEPKYQVHIICGVNSQVSGPVYCPGGSSLAPHKCYHSHVNFIATPRIAHSEAGKAPILFFAEVSNDEVDEAEAHSLCYPVCVPPPCAEHVRCMYCDYVGARIVHPIQEKFHGREREFEKMVCGEDPCADMVSGEDRYVMDPALIQTCYTNTDMIRHSRLIADVTGSLKEDCLYADYSLEESDSDDCDSDVVYGSDYDVYE